MTSRADTYDEIACDLLYGVSVFEDMPEPPARPLSGAVLAHLQDVASHTPDATRSPRATGEHAHDAGGGVLLHNPAPSPAVSSPKSTSTRRGAIRDGS